MIRLALSEAAAAVRGALDGRNLDFAGCGTDSRSIARGALFVALHGPAYDGHDFVAHAAGRGAAAAMVDDGRDHPLPVIRVPDTLRALGDLARFWRRRHRVTVVGITGSNGKTTVKEMIGCVHRGGGVLATRGNLNNQIGVPLTLLGLQAAHEVAVVEMGANRPGEIAALAAIAEPDVAVITHCGPAHLEGFGTIEGVARAKGELIVALPGSGVAVVNADDTFAPLWREFAGSRRIIDFSVDAPAAVRGRWRSNGDGLTLDLSTPLGAAAVRLALPGRHNAANAAAAAAASLAVGRVDLATIRDGLEATRPVAGRCQPRAGRGGVRLLDDTYNANPMSLDAGLATLADLDGPRWLVLADMAELGSRAAEYHARAGARARDRGVERLYATGPLSRLAVEGFGAGARHFDTREALVEALLTDLDREAAVLVKGSRSMGMERVVEALLEH